VAVTSSGTSMGMSERGLGVAGIVGLRGALERVCEVGHAVVQQGLGKGTRSAIVLEVLPEGPEQR